MTEEQFNSLIDAIHIGVRDAIAGVADELKGIRKNLEGFRSHVEGPSHWSDDSAGDKDQPQEGE